MEQYARVPHLSFDKSYFIVPGQGNWKRLAEGHKASFCLEDTECDPGFEKKWNCTRGGDQGISPGCFDIYSQKIDCQWIDYTGVFSSSFYLRVQLNPGNQVAESDFRNNVAKCTVYDYGRFIIASKCWIGKLFFLNSLSQGENALMHAVLAQMGYLKVYFFNARCNVISQRLAEGTKE